MQLISADHAVLAGAFAILFATCWYLWSKLKEQKLLISSLRSELKEQMLLTSRLSSSLLKYIEGSASCGSDTSSDATSDASTVIKFIKASTIKEEEFKTFMSGRGVTFIKKDDISYPKLDSKNPNHEKYWNEVEHEAASSVVARTTSLISKKILGNRQSKFVVKPWYKIVRGHGVSLKNDHFLTLQSKADYSSALIGFENKRNILPRHVFQAICELLLCGEQACRPFIQVLSNLETVAIVFYYVHSSRSVEYRVFYSMPEYWNFIKVLIQSLPEDLDNESLLQITAGGLLYDRCPALRQPARSTDSDIANLSDLDAFFEE